MGINSVKEFSARTGISRDAVTKAEKGTGSVGTYERLEAWLDAQELAVHATEQHGMVEFDVTGPKTDWHVVVRGPADIADDLRRQVVELLRNMDDGV